MHHAATPPAPDPLVSHLLRLAQQAARAGDLATAEQLCASVLAIDPAQTQPAQFLVGRALANGDAARARSIAERSLQHAPSAAVQVLLARALADLGEPGAARDAYAAAHARDPDLLPALFGQAEQEAALGMADAHLRTCHRALHAAEVAGAMEPGREPPVELAGSIERALAVVHAARAAAIEQALAPLRARHGSDAITLIEQAAEIHLGDRDLVWPHPLQRPTFLLIPGLEPRPWFERGELPFLADIERHTDAIARELLAILSDESLLSPYVDMPEDAPAAPVWRELNRSPRWSSHHLLRHGERIEPHCQRCPHTLQALESISLMRVPEHSPEALFSLLKAGTRIPPHTGVMNGRLTVHLPLVVPAECGALRAGDESRAWTRGECLVFDDSFVHEAWNTSVQDRAVLIFDVWDPRLSLAEREAVSALIAAIGRFNRAYCDADASVEAR